MVSHIMLLSVRRVIFHLIVDVNNTLFEYLAEKTLADISTVFESQPDGPKS